MKIHLYIIVLMIAVNTFGQNYLSNLSAVGNDPVYTTYASAYDATKYSTDVAYRLIWNDPDKGVVLHSEQSGTIGFLFRTNNNLKTRLGEYSKPPEITTSYSNLFKLSYYPFKDLEVKYFGIIRDSETLILEVELINHSSIEVGIDIYPYIHSGKEKLYSIKETKDGVSFTHRRKADQWMKEHNIPFAEELFNQFIVSSGSLSKGMYDTIPGFIQEKLNGSLTDNYLAVLHLQFKVKPGKTEKFKLVRTVSDKSKLRDDKQIKEIFQTNMNSYVKRNEDLYRGVPDLNFQDKDEEAVYWNSFNLMRQCMMGPEGKSSFNYYVFSREPKWGWGYGGQVFHESIVMLAYSYLDRVSAMNSQRVYFERQHPNGYINYRTGPYLDEQIPEKSQLTSSAPWFNWQNYEIYKITKDRKFLEEAYRSGKRFYEFFISTRDTDKDGLCEWGGNAVLESVRDGKAAVWDEVGDPKNFEAVDCNMMLVKEAKSLANMAAELGLLDDVSRFRKDASQRTYLINRFMWDDSTGFYYNINKGDHTFTYKEKNDLKRKEIIGFLGLWSGVADKDKASRLVEHLKNPDEFYRRYGVPTLSADDPYYNPMGYWNGPVWLPWQYLVFRGLIDYGYADEAIDLKDRVLKNVIDQLKENNYFWELYSPDDLEAGWKKPYIWSGIISRFLIDLDKLK